MGVLLAFWFGGSRALEAMSAPALPPSEGIISAVELAEDIYDNCSQTPAIHFGACVVGARRGSEPCGSQLAGAARSNAKTKPAWLGEPWNGPPAQGLRGRIYIYQIEAEKG
jgi:hypothetical protein